MIKEKKGFLQISFAWVFAILVGVFILFLAIFAVTKFTGTERTAQDAETAKEIGVLLNPLETGFETGKTSLLKNSVDTRIYCRCSESGSFGKQTIKISQKVYEKWSETDINVAFPNKYIFAEYPVEGKNFYVFTKPFEFPFKIADLIYIIPSNKKYCFIDADEIKDEISDLQKGGLLDNILFEESKDCPPESTKVCFKGGGLCDITVSENSIKRYNEKEIYFKGDALMYAGIFSNNETYECQLKRLMKRTEQLALLYEDKSDFVFDKTGCISDLKTELLILENKAKNFENSEEIFALSFLAETIQSKNDNEGGCRLW